MMLKLLTIAVVLLFSTSALAAEYVPISPDRCVSTRSAAVAAARDDSYSIKSNSNAGYGTGSFVLCVLKNGVYSFWHFESSGAKWCRTGRRSNVLLNSSGNCDSKFP